MCNDEKIFRWALVSSLIILLLLTLAHYGGLFFPRTELIFSGAVIFFQIIAPIKILEAYKIKPREYNIYAHKIDALIDYIWPPFGPKAERVDFYLLGKEFKYLLIFSLLTLVFYSASYLAYFKIYALSSGASLKLSLNIPPRFFYEIILQIFVVAVPEEIFYRGFLQSALLKKWPNQRFFLGFPMGRAIIFTNLIFALAHFFGPFSAIRLLTFFPGLLFSYLAFKNKSIFSAILFHALCNLLGQILYASVFIY